MKKKMKKKKEMKKNERRRITKNFQSRTSKTYLWPQFRKSGCKLHQKNKKEKSTNKRIFPIDKNFVLKIHETASNLVEQIYEQVLENLFS